MTVSPLSDTTIGGRLRGIAAELLDQADRLEAQEQEKAAQAKFE